MENQMTSKRQTITIVRKTVSDDYSLHLKATNTPTSYDITINKIKQLCMVLYNKPYFKLELVPDTETIKLKFKEFSTDGVRGRMYYVLYSLLEFYKINRPELKVIGDEYYELSRSNVKVDESKTIDYQEVAEMRNTKLVQFANLSLTEQVSLVGKTLYLHCLLLCFYSTETYRISNFENCGFRDDGTNNYIDLAKCTITFRKFKTSETYGTQTFEVAKEICQFIGKYHQELFKGTKYLFPQLRDSSKSMTCEKSGSLTKFLYRMNEKFFDKSIGCNALRKAKVSEELDNGASVLTIISNANKAQHSIETRFGTYSTHSEKYRTDDSEYLLIQASKKIFPISVM